jgi:hypothetical protein
LASLPALYRWSASFLEQLISSSIRAWTIAGTPTSTLMLWCLSLEYSR